MRSCCILSHLHDINQDCTYVRRYWEIEFVRVINEIGSRERQKISASSLRERLETRRNRFLVRVSPREVRTNEVIGTK